MGKEPRPHAGNFQRVPGSQSNRPGAPYTGARRPTPSSSASSITKTAAAKDPSTQQPALPRLTVHNFATFSARVKKLPPDANTSAAKHVRFYQLPERVCFGCTKCRRDNIQSDSVAVDVRNKVVLCTHCFTRIIRPRQYRPSRVVPFPSLLSWLSYKPSAATTVSEDVMERPAEAVAPSGERRAAPTLGRGDRPSAIDRLPNIATNIVPTAAGPGARGHHQRGGAHGNTNTNNNNNNNNNRNSHHNSGDTGKAGTQGKHPCLRVWGACAHGDLCQYRDAPAELCLAYLMGLCGGPHSEAAGSGAKAHGGRHRGRRGKAQSALVVSAVNEERKDDEGYPADSRPVATAAGPSRGPRRACRLVHQDVFDLPNPMARSTMPSVRYAGDIDTSAADADGEGEASHDKDDTLDERAKMLRENRRLWLKWLEKRVNSPNSAEWQLWNNGPVRALFDQYVPTTPRPAPLGAPPGAKPEEAEEEEAQEAVPAPPVETAVKLNLLDIQAALRGLK